MKKFILPALLVLTPTLSWALWLKAARAPGQSPDEVIATQIIPDSPADKAGVKRGDILLSVGDHALASCPDLVAQVKSAPESSTLTLRRAGKTVVLPVTLGIAGASGPRLGVRCVSGYAYGVAFPGPNSLLVAAYTSAKISLVRILYVNQSGKAIHLAPSQVNAADGNRSMLRHLDNQDAFEILQGDKPAPAAAAVPTTGGGDNGNMAETLSGFLFSRIGLGGPVSHVASQLVGTAASAASAARNAQAAAATAAPAKPAVTRSVVDQEALADADLESGYSAEGIVYLTGTQALPLTVMVDFDGQKLTFKFEAPPPPAAATNVAATKKP